MIDQIQALTKASHLKVTPVLHLDPSQTIGVDSYEIPDWIRQQVIARNPYCVFPWSSTESRRLDLDHTIPYQAGEPNQTNPANLGPLTRRAHRVKTHAGWKLTQPEPGVFVWVSGAGQEVQVDPTGSHPIPNLE